MIRHTIATAALLLAGTACSAQHRSNFPQAQGMTDEGPKQADGAAMPGPHGPQPAGADQPVPKNSPLEPDIRDVAATTGRGNVTPTPSPFAVAEIGQFQAPFAIALLPGGDALVTEKAGALKWRRHDGKVLDVAGTPTVAQGGQGGLLGVATAPDYARSGMIYLSYAEPAAHGSQLALASARLVTSGAPHLADLHVIWRSGSAGPGGQFGAKIAFSPDGKYLFLTSGERQRFTPAQDPDQLLGKIVRLTLDGHAAPGNPFAGAAGKGDPVKAMVWSSGHRNPYGLVFTPDGRLWEEEMGPKGGDELNLIEPGRNYGWPIVSNGDNYSGQPIPDHPSRPEFAAPALWWNPSISPGGMIYYKGAMFPALRGSLLIGALSGNGLAQVALNGATAAPAAFWDMGTRIRDVAEAPDGSIWLLEDGERGAGGRLLRLTPKG